MRLEDAGRLIVRSLSKKRNDRLTVIEKSFPEINRAVQEFDGVKTRLHLREPEKALDSIRAAVLMNDLVTVSLPMGGSSAIHMLPQERMKEILGGDGDFKLQTDRPEEFRNEAGELIVTPAFMMRNDDVAETIMDAVRPLSMRGRVLVLPDRGLISHERLDSDGRDHWKIHPVDPNLPTDRWDVTYGKKSTGTETLQGDSSKPEYTLSDISMPFVAGIGFYDLARVLEDEGPLFHNTRIALQAAMRAAQDDHKTLAEILNDMVRPEVESLGRKIETLLRSRSLKQSGALAGTAILTIAGIATGGLAAVGSAIAAPAGLALLYKQEAEHLEKIAEAKESPYYMLWRLRKLRAQNR